MTPTLVRQHREAAEAALETERQACRHVIRRLIDIYEAARKAEDPREAQRLRFDLQAAMIEAVDLDCGWIAGWPKRIVYGLTHHMGVWRDLTTVPHLVRAEIEVLLEGQVALARRAFELGG